MATTKTAEYVYYWTGKGGDGSWTTALNWAVGSPNGTNNGSYPGAAANTTLNYYDTAYINNGNWNSVTGQFDNTINITIKPGEYKLRGLYFTPSASLTINSFVMLSGTTSSDSWNSYTFFGLTKVLRINALTINSNCVTTKSSFQYYHPSTFNSKYRGICLYSLYNTQGVEQPMLLHTGGKEIGISFFHQQIGSQYKLLSDFVLSNDRFFTFQGSKFDLNGYSLTAGLVYVTDYNQSSIDYYAEIIFKQHATTGARSYINISGGDGVTDYTSGKFSIIGQDGASGALLGGIKWQCLDGQPNPIFIWSYSGSANRTVYIPIYNLGFGTSLVNNTDTYSILSSPNQRPSWVSRNNISSQYIIDIYIIDGFSDTIGNTRTLISLPSAVAKGYSPLLGDFVCDGTTPGTLPTGPGCQHGLGWDIDYPQMTFCKNIVFPPLAEANGYYPNSLWQAKYSTSTTIKYPIFCLLHNTTGMASNWMPWRGNTNYATTYEGWVINFNGYSSTPSSTNTDPSELNRLVISVSSGVNLYFVSNVQMIAAVVFCENNTANVFLTGSSQIVWWLSFELVSGTISTVYGDGVTTHLANADALGITNTKLIKYPSFSLIQGTLDLYSDNDIFLRYSVDKSNNYYYGYFVVKDMPYYTTYYTTILGSPTILFNFLSEYSREGLMPYINGMIQTDVFDITATINKLNVYVNSDTGNLVTGASTSDTPPNIAIGVNWAGYYQTSSDVSSSIIKDLSNYNNSSSTKRPYQNDFVIFNTPDYYCITLLNQYPNTIGYTAAQNFPDALAFYVYEWQSGGPITVNITTKNHGAWTSKSYAILHLGSIISRSPACYLIIKQNGEIYQRVLLDNSTTVVMAGLDTRRIAGSRLTGYPVYSSTPPTTVKIAHREAGHLFSNDNMLTGNRNQNVYNLVPEFRFSGGNPAQPAQIDVLSQFNPNIYIEGGYYVIQGSTQSIAGLYVTAGTVDQTLNTRAQAPSFKFVNFDSASSPTQSTFVHGTDNYTIQPIAFNITGWSGVLWSSNNSRLTITTVSPSDPNLTYAPSIINFTNYYLNSVTVLPGTLRNYGNQVPHQPGQTEAVSTSTSPNFNALIFDFSDQATYGMDSYSSVRFESYLEEESPMLVQTLIFGQYQGYDFDLGEYTWQGRTGMSIYFGASMIFCANDTSPASDTLRNSNLNYFAGSVYDQLGGLIIPSTGYSIGGMGGEFASYDAKLYFQGSGIISIYASSMIPVVVGTSTYQYVMFTNQPGLKQSSGYSSLYPYYFNTFLDVPNVTSEYIVVGNYGDLKFMGGNIDVRTHPYTNNRVSLTATSLTIQDTIGPTSFGGYTRVYLQGASLYLGSLGITDSLVIFPSTVTNYFSADSGYGENYIYFYDGSVFNAYMGTYTNIAIGSWKKSSEEPTPTITINPCTDFTGLVPSRAQFDDLAASGLGPAIFKFTAKSTTTFVNFTYNDTAAPYDSNSDWYGYNNTANNTVLQSVSPSYQFNISVLKPHRGTFNDGRVVNNMTIKDSNAIDKYLWFAPGTVNTGTGSGTAFRPGYAYNSTYYGGTNVPYYNFDAGNNTGWIFNTPPTPGMDMMFWPNSTYDWTASPNTHTFETQHL